VLSWSGTHTVSGRLYALQWTAGATSNLPTAYHGWGVEQLTVTSGQASSATIALSAVSQEELAGTLRFPAASKLVNLAGHVGNIMVGLTNIFPQNGATSQSYRFLVPTGITEVSKFVAGQAYSQNLSLSSQAWAKVTDSVLVQDLDLVAPPVEALPVDRATGVDPNTEFVWTPVANAVHCVTAMADDNSVTFEICTKAAKANLPDTASKGIPLSAGRYTWTVRALGPAAGTDDLVTGQDLLALKGKKFEAVSGGREFTAGP
jgi:hypothetical protein